MSKIFIEFSSDSKHLFEPILSDYPNETDLFSSESFSGADNVLQFVAVLVPLLTTPLVPIIIALINAQKTFKVRLKTKDGAEFEVDCKGKSIKKVKELIATIPKEISDDSDVVGLINQIIKVNTDE
jgi:hypothetical protein